MDTSNRLPIVVYTKNNCQPCRLTKDYLTKHKIRYVEFNVEDEPEAYQKVIDMGYQQVPVVVVPFDWQATARHWSGLRPDLLATIK